MIGCGIKPENRDKAYAEIEKQLRNMQRGCFDENDINTAKRTVISGLKQIFDSSVYCRDELSSYARERIIRHRVKLLLTHIFNIFFIRLEYSIFPGIAPESFLIRMLFLRSKTFQFACPCGLCSLADLRFP